MSESIFNILQKRDKTEPPEIATIKQFVHDRFNEPVNIQIKKNQIIVLAKNAALAGTLRMHIVDLQKLLRTKSKIIIRIG